MTLNFIPSTIPIEAAQARINAASFLAPTTEIILNNLNTLISAASMTGLYSITYTAGPLSQFVINQLVSVGYTVVDTSVTNVPPTPVYFYQISWQQINYPAAGQPA